MGEKTNSKILTPSELREKRRRDATGEVTIPRLEAPKPFPTLADIQRPPPEPIALAMAPETKLPLSRPGPTDQRQKPTSAQYSGLIRRRPRPSHSA